MTRRGLGALLMSTDNKIETESTETEIGPLASISGGGPLALESPPLKKLFVLEEGVPALVPAEGGVSALVPRLWPLPVLSVTHYWVLSGYCKDLMLLLGFSRGHANLFPQQIATASLHPFVGKIRLQRKRSV